MEDKIRNDIYDTSVRSEMFDHIDNGTIFDVKDETLHKAIVVEIDNYLLALSRYIHLNPVKIKQIKKLAKNI